MQVLLDIDLSQFSLDSDWYNYDGSASETYFGPLFRSGTFLYEGQTCAKPILSTSNPPTTIILTMLRRYVEFFGFNGFWWRGLLCLRLTGQQCEKGVGADDTSSIQFLRSLRSENWVQMGEDTRGEVNVENPTSIIQNIAASTASRGLGFQGQLVVSL